MAWPVASVLGRLDVGQRVVKLGRSGLISAGIYTGVFFLALTEAFSEGPLRVGCFAQLAVFPAVLLLVLLPIAMGLGSELFVPADSWMNSIYVLYLVSAAIAYLFGYAIAITVNGVRRRLKRRSQPDDRSRADDA